MTAARRTALLLAVVALVLGLGDRDAVAPQAAPELDVLVAVDRTTSMSALDDPAGSRITAVRRDLVALGDRLGPARFAVVTFGETAATRLPFTSDRGSFDAEVSTVQVERADAGAGSSVGLAVPLLESMLRSASRASVERVPVVVFVSDGENTGDEAQQSFREVGDLTEAAVVLAYGTSAGGPMPLRRVGLEEEPPTVLDPPAAVPTAKGGVALSRADEANLRVIADELDGDLVTGVGDDDLAEVAATLNTAAYAGLEPGRPERELRWLWALLVLLLVAPELRRGWRTWLGARRETVR